MNVKLEKTLTIKEILQTIENTTLAESRGILYERTGAVVAFSGEVLKKIIRHEHLRLLIRPDDLPIDKSFQIFAEFTDAIESAKVQSAKIRKGSKVKLSGFFNTSGYSAININHCKLVNPKSTKALTKKRRKK
jgi:hypothetical protein